MNDSELVATPARPEDLPEVIRLVESFDLPTQGIAEAFPQSYAVVRSDTELVGVAGLETYADVGLLRSVAVATAERGRRLGRTLVENRLALARQQRLTRVYLLTLTAADYFRQLGFSDADRARAPASIQHAPEFTTLCPASAVCLAVLL